jgi:ABC-type multidrug transport system ATPase subunit
VSGDLHYNGRPANRDLKRQIAYVLQDDILFPHLTVQETLSYTAQLRQPGDMSYEDKMLKVDEVISALNLNKARHTIIGDSTQRGVSGGERKRVNIGVQLLSDPSAIFLDEPTSGLDTSTAFSLVKTLRSIAKSGYTVAATIHQPASHIFDLFDKVVVRVAYISRLYLSLLRSESALRA